MVEFKYLGPTVINHYDIYEQINRKLNKGSACCSSVQNHFNFPAPEHEDYNIHNFYMVVNFNLSLLGKNTL